MEFPKLVYDDFYKFLMSLGIILFVISIGLGISITNDLISNYQLLFIILCILIFVLSILIMICAGGKWYRNQRITDEILEKNCELKKLSIEREKIGLKLLIGPEPFTIKPEEVRITAIEEVDGVATKEQTIKQSLEKKSEKINNIALVACKITSVLPNSVEFNFLKEFKVWFRIFNYDPIKYLAYVKIKFITDNLEEESTSDYYNGLKAWRLNAYSGIQAPGLGFSEEIKNAARQGKRIKIEINCKIHDELNKPVEEKLPQTYVYNPEDNSWYYEP
ncbi:MAG: hypothetical protein V1686_02815 [Patescibacteria group bacterium]